VSGNGRVSFRDVAIITRAVAKGQYRIEFDVNHDGRLSHADITAAAKQVGKRC
jgi:hypothetical protein